MRFQRLGAPCCALLLSAAPAVAADSSAVAGPVTLDTGATAIGKVPLVQASGSAPISISTATTTKLLDAPANPAFKTFVTHFDVIAGGTGTITFEYGTQTTTPCDTGTTALTGAYSLAAQAGLSAGDGLGPVMVAPAGKQLCAVTSAAVQMSGGFSYAQLPPQQ